MVMKRVPSFSQRPGFPSGLRVLLVDADSQARSRTEALLTECSYQVTSCSSTAEALSRLSADASTGPSSFDVLLADKSMVAGRMRERQHLMHCFKGLPCILMADSPSPKDVMQGIEMGAVDFLAKPLSPLKLRNIWQHTVRKMMGEMNINCPHTASKPARAASVPVPASAKPVVTLPAKLGKAASVAAPLLPWGLVTCQSDDEESSDLDDVAPAAGTAAATRCATGESVRGARPPTASAARGTGARMGRVHSCPSTRSLQSTSSSRSSLSVVVVPGSPGGASATPTTATPQQQQQQQQSGESSGDDGAGKKVIKRAVRHLPAPALATSRPTLALKPGSSAGMALALPQQQQQQQQQACMAAVPLPTGLGPLPSGMVWGMPMTTLARAPGITPPIMPGPMAWGPMGAMCAPAGMCAPPMLGMPLGAVGPVCPPPGFPAMGSFPGMVPCSVGPNGVPTIAIGSHASSSVPMSGSQQQHKAQQKAATRSASAPSPFSLSSVAMSASDAGTTAEAALNAIASLDFEFQADDDDVVRDVDELMAQIDLKPDCCELGTSASAPPGASCLALEPEELAAACSGDGSLGGGVCGMDRAASCCPIYGDGCSPESSEDHLTRCDSASVLPSLESLFGLQGDECSSDLLPPLDAPLGLCLKKTGSLADMISEGLAIQAA